MKRPGVTVRAPTNIALIKYWGKLDPVFNLPLNSSLSLSVDISQFFTETRVFLTDDPQISMVLNEKQSAITKRILSVISEIKKFAPQELREKGVKIETFNNFPTAAGMASSASGLCALTFALSQVYSLDLPNEELSKIARLGSGSASRSMFGGIVEWKSGPSHDLSFAQQVFPVSQWPGLRLLVVITNSEQKSVSSTEAMQIRTDLLARRAEQLVPERLAKMKEAIGTRDFPGVARIMMEESDCLHSCINSVGVSYLNEVSENVKGVVRHANEGEVVAGYTFDAGPNAWILVEERNLETVLRALLREFRVRRENVRTERDILDFDQLQRESQKEVEGIIETRVSESGPIVLE